jgi:RNA polymerase primary sigma factor
MAKASRNRLVQHNLRIVDHWVRRLIEHSSVADKISFYELLVEGIVGLTKAATKFDGRGVRFYEFAQPWVRSELYAGITRLRPGSFVSHRTIMVASRAKRTKKQLEKMLNRTVTGEEVASVLGMTPSTMESFIEAASKQVISIDTKISNKMAVSAYGDVEQGYQDLDFKEPAEPADMVFWLADFNNALDILDPLERRTLQYRYGLLDGTPKSIYTTADLMCMSVETVRLTIATAQAKLKRSPASSFLEEGRPQASTLSNGNAGQPIY